MPPLPRDVASEAQPPGYGQPGPHGWADADVRPGRGWFALPVLVGCAAAAIILAAYASKVGLDRPSVRDVLVSLAAVAVVVLVVGALWSALVVRRSEWVNRRVQAYLASRDGDRPDPWSRD